MKKLIIVLCLVVFSCQSIKENHGAIKSKGVDKIDIEALYDSFKIKSTDKDEKYLELYWVKLHGSQSKLYISQFCYEEYDIGDVIEIDYCKDDRIEFGE